MYFENGHEAPAAFPRSLESSLALQVPISYKALEILLSHAHAARTTS